MTRVPDPPQTIPARRFDLLFAAVLAVVAIAAAAVRLVPDVTGVYHDDGVYVSTAKALAEGRGYRLIHLPDAPPQTRYPPLYPLLLSAVWRLSPSFPGNLAYMLWLQVVMSGLAVGLAYLYVVRRGYFTREVAAGAGLLCATAPFYGYFSTMLLSEIPFALLLVLSLTALERYSAASSASRASRILTGAALSLPFLCRTAGIVVPAAAAVHLWRSGRPMRLVLATSASFILPWLAWVTIFAGLMRSSPVEGYNDYYGWWTRAALGTLLPIVWSNLGSMVRATFEMGLQGFVPILSNLGPTAVLVTTTIVGSLAWLPILGRLRTPRALPWVLAAYGGLVLAWPWPPGRFLVPILFFLLAYLLALIGAAATRFLPARAGSALLAIVVLAGVGLNGVLLRDLVPKIKSHHYPYAPMAQQAAGWSSYQQVFAWLRANSRPQDVVAGPFDSMIYLYSDRRCVRPYTLDPRTAFYGAPGPLMTGVAEMEKLLASYRVRYIVQMAMPAYIVEEGPYNARVVALLARSPDRARAVFTGTDPRFKIYRLRDGGK